jgi:hypothetical protein
MNEKDWQTRFPDLIERGRFAKEIACPQFTDEANQVKEWKSRQFVQAFRLIGKDVFYRGIGTVSNHTFDLLWQLGII